MSISIRKCQPEQIVTVLRQIEVQERVRGDYP